MERNDSFGSQGGTGLPGTGGLGGGTATPGTTGPGAANTPSFGSGSTPGSTGGPSTGGSGGSTGVQQGGAMSEVTDRANQAMDQAADRLEGAAERLKGIGGRASSGSTGASAQMGSIANGAAGAMESTARYLRDNDVQALRQDLEGQVRENPLQTLLIGVAAGWIVGKILR